MTTDYPVPTNNAAPNSTALGSDGKLYFTEFGFPKIGQVTP